MRQAALLSVVYHEMENAQPASSETDDREGEIIPQWALRGEQRVAEIIPQWTLRGEQRVAYPLSVQLIPGNEPERFSSKTVYSYNDGIMTANGKNFMYMDEIGDFSVVFYTNRDGFKFGTSKTDSVTVSTEDVNFDGELVGSHKQQEILDVLGEGVQLRENVKLRFIILPGTS